jgi:NAD-dependent SIR2 family protein deacetylase
VTDHGRVQSSLGPGQPAGLDALAQLVHDGEVAVLSGAGLSTESGIPDYRGPTGAARPSSPMTYQVFTGDPAARRRYWARSHLGWGLIAQARPNDGHRAVAALQAAGVVDGVVTQNVDGLHTAAGSRDVVELHGTLDRVVCLTCGDLSARSSLAERLREANPGWDAEATGINPDGDVSLPDEALDGFSVVPCVVCGGVLKPDVVFFGETVPPERVAASFALVHRPRAARPRVLAEGHVGPPLRAAGGQARHPRRDRQPGRDARRPRTRRSSSSAARRPRCRSWWRAVVPVGRARARQAHATRRRGTSSPRRSPRRSPGAAGEVGRRPGPVHPGQEQHLGDHADAHARPGGQRRRASRTPR